ncbi:major pollen allergen Bet v 1-F/I-like [Alnus glutinosa]|uniref:major pollen allergen Bet v 1-F/I-like n=1 Tax=Alnus glutinosa TaxID=3517 RepID=UPI002D7A22CB|nr:major pollen allergen Bet v 1-F/I-like [Alnus glutinosa]
MAVFNDEFEATSVIPPARLFKSFVLDADNIIMKVAPQAFKGSENIQGNGGPGTIKKITFAEGSHLHHIKQRVDEIDHANYKFSYSVIEGSPLGDTLEKISKEIKIVAVPGGGSILKITSKYHTKGNISVNKELIKADKEKGEGLLRAIESYLLAHPDAYN